MSKLEGSDGKNTSFDGIFPDDIPPQSKAALNQGLKQPSTEISAYADNIYVIEVDDNDGCLRHNTLFPPGIQQMAIEDLNSDEEEEPNKESLESVIFKRLLSAIFIIIDCVVDWWNFSETNNSVDNSTADTSIFIDAFQRMTEIKNAVKGASKVECETTTLLLTCVYAILLAFGTLYGVLQLINIFAETLVELVAKKNKKKQSSCQTFHGWTETFGSLLLQDIPQVTVLVLFAGSCQHEHATSQWTLLLAVVPLIKNIFRQVTCKQDKGIRFSSCCKIRRFSLNVPFSCCFTNYNCFEWVMCGYPSKKMKLNHGDYDNGFDEKYDPNKWVCCKCIPLVWECIGTSLCVGSLIVCRHRGCCDKNFKEKTCCSWVWKGCCKDCCKVKCQPTTDPIRLLPFIKILYGIEIMLTCLLFAFRWSQNIFNTNALFEKF